VFHVVDKNLDTAYFRAIARYHDATRFPVTIGCLGPEGSLQASMRGLGVGTFALGANARTAYPLALVHLVSLLRRERPALLHAHTFDATLMGLVAARVTRTRFVFTRHHSDHHVRMRKRWHTAADAWCAKRADRVIAVSEATRRVMVEVEGVSPTRIVVVHNGLDPLPEPDASRVTRLREDLALGDRPVGLVTARLHEEKGHRVLLEAMAHLTGRAERAVFLFAGEGPERQALEEETSRRGLRERVRFLGFRSDIADLIGVSEVVVLPSLAESFGFSVAEAMSLGRPVVATTTGGIPEIIVHGESGLLVPPDNNLALAEAIRAVLNDPENAARLGEAGRQRAGRFSTVRMTQGYEAVYERFAA
jgi:glycosyltransferase involved in cell wall biosynthesis